MSITALMTVLSIMNGFTEALSQRLAAVLPHITILSKQHWLDLETLNAVDPKFRAQIQTITHGLKKEVYLLCNNEMTPLLIEALPEPARQKTLTQLGYTGSTAEAEGIITSQTIQKKCDLRPGSRLELMLPSPPSTTPDNQSLSWLDLDTHPYAGVFYAGYPFFESIGFAPLHVILNDSLLYQNRYQSTYLSLSTPFEAEKWARLLQTHPLTRDFLITHWMDQLKPYLNIFAQTKQMMVIILSFIVLVAVFNTLATLQTLIDEKKAEIAILKTLGASRGTITTILITQNALLSTLGIGLGLCIGYGLSASLTSIVNALQFLLHTQWINPALYWIDYLPVHWVWADAVKIGISVYALTFLSAVIPAVQAGRLSPITGLGG
jgi:lipoprotein-releasing system permease protein